MNYMFCRIKKDCEDSENQHITANTFEDGGVYLKIVQNFNKKSIIRKDGLVLGFMGEIFEQTGELSEVEYVLWKYLQEGVSGIRMLNGFFTIVIIDVAEKSVSVCQDTYTSLEHIYYCLNKEAMFISSKLEDVISSSGISREVNTAMLPTYLHYSFLPGNETLMKHVYKIPSNHLLIYYIMTGKQELKKQDVSYLENQNLNKNLIAVIQESIKNRIDTDKKIGFALSGGFDSNLLFSLASEQLRSTKINIFSYGYDSPKSEISNVERIIDLYRNDGLDIRHFKYYAKTEDIYKLPQVIGFLQEPILEPGLIFHYGLAELMEKQWIEVLLGGDCNDQVYDRRLYYDMIAKMQEPIEIEQYPIYGRLRLGEFDRIHTYKYFTDIEAKWILNTELDFEELKLSMEVYSEVFTNYFMTKRFFVKEHNASVRLPFLDYNYVSYINNNLNVDELPFKKYHLDLCKEYIPEDIYNELVNATEATSPYSYLFLEDDTIRKDIFDMMKASKTLTTYFNVNAVKTLLDSFETALFYGRNTENYYKASILSCRIFAILGFLVWHDIYIKFKDEKGSLSDVLVNQYR
ncbi:MAG: asparagine synthase-related protein [Lachnospiraceae bacterium]